MNEPRSYHRPISILVETIDRLPYVRTLPNMTQMTINLKFNRTTAQNMVLFLQEELERTKLIEDDYIAVTITGPSP